MKKIVFILVLLLLTAPAWATVTIDANQVGDTNEVEITYVSDGNLPRAFGLDITVTDGNIVAVIAAMEGECTATVRGFGIFPSTIVINDQVTPPVISFAGTPLSTVQPALGGLDTNGVTIEAGSLYQEPNAPDLSGVICTIVVTKSCIVRIAGNAARCGEGSPAYGVVMEDETEIPIVTFGDANVIIVEGPEDCMSSDHPAYDDWVLWGKPDCWCYSRNCRGDADGLKIGPFWVQAVDLNTMVAAYAKIDTALATVTNGICADFDHTKIGPFRVQAVDLNTLVSYYAKIETFVPECDPTDYNFWETP